MIRVRRRSPGSVLAVVTVWLLAVSCSDASGQLTTSEVLIDAEPPAPAVAGVTTQAPTTTTTAPTTTEPAEPSSTIVPAPGVTLAPVAPTGVELPLLVFGDSIMLVQPDGSASLIQREAAIRVAGDSGGGVVFQRELVPGALSSIIWQPSPSATPIPIFIPDPDQQAELHGVTVITGSPEAVFSVTSPNSDTRVLNRIGLQSGIITELTVVDDAEFGSKATQVDGSFIVTTWERPDGAGWTVYQSGTGRAIGGSFPEDEASCVDGRGASCPRLASLSIDIETVFRIVPNHGDAHPGHYDLLMTSSENGREIGRIDLTTAEGAWYPERLTELPDRRILLSRAVDPERLRPTTGVVIDLETGAVTELGVAGFVRLP